MINWVRFQLLGTFADFEEDFVKPIEQGGCMGAWPENVGCMGCTVEPAGVEPSCGHRPVYGSLCFV